MKLENRKQIAAPKSIVWSVTVDVTRWPQWSPFVQTVERLDDGPFEVGSVALIKQTGLPKARWQVTAITPGEQFTWETRVRGIDMVATHELSSSGTNTSSVLRIEMRGFMALLMWPLLRVLVPKALESENTGLKAECESLGACAAR
jgi:hypothetical protein